MHAMYNSKEVKAIKTRLIRLQKELVDMRYVFTPEELTGLYSLLDNLEELEWRRECHEDFRNEQVEITSDRLRDLLRDISEGTK